MIKAPATFVRASAPCRLDLAGGPSDVEPMASHGGCVVNVAVALRSWAEVELDTGSGIVVEDLREDRLYDLKTLDDAASVPALQLVRSALTRSGLTSGIRVRVGAAVPRGSGMGGSAALGVALLAALGTYRDGVMPDRETLFHQALEMETLDLGTVAGGQDQRASVYGGLSVLRYGKQGMVADSMTITRSTRDCIERGLIIADAGAGRLSSNVLTLVRERFRSGDANSAASLQRLVQTAESIAERASALTPTFLGPMLTAAWTAQKALSSRVSTPRIEALLAIGLSAGAKGGKVLGAGGGGYVLLASEYADRPTVRAALVATGTSTLTFGVEDEGVRLDAFRSRD